METTTQSKSLFQISTEFLALNQRIMEEEGILTEETEKALEIAEADLQRKAEGYAYVILKNQSECEAIDAEIERLTKLKKPLENATERMRESLKHAMILFGKDKIEGRFVKLSLRSSESCVVLDEEAVPEEFIERKPRVKVAEIKKHIKEGNQVAYAEIQTNKNLQIR